MYSMKGKQRRKLLDLARKQINESKDRELIDSLEFEGLTFNSWDDAFNALNARFWRGNLKKIPVSVTSTSKHWYGLYSHKRFCERITLATNKGLSSRELLGVLLHEMCHHAVHIKYGHGKESSRGTRVIGHGKEWKAEMGRVGYLGKITRFSGKERFVT